MRKKLVIVAVALALVIALMAGVWYATRPETETGSKAYTVVNIYEGTEIVRTSEDVAGLNVDIADGSTVNMYGGIISGGTAIEHAALGAGKFGGNVLMKVSIADKNLAYTCTFNMLGGIVENGTAEVKGGNIAVIRYAAKEFEVSDSYIYGGLGHRGGNVYVGHFAKDIPVENTDCVFTRVEMNGGNTTYRGANMCSDTKNAQRPVQVTFNDCIMGVEDASEVNLAIGAGAYDVTQCIITINGGTFTGGGLSLYGSSVTTATGVTFVDCAAGGTGEYIENP